MQQAKQPKQPKGAPKTRKGAPLVFPQPVEELLTSDVFTSVRIANLPQQLGLTHTTTDANGHVHTVQAIKVFFLQHTTHTAKESYRPGGGAKYISATSRVSLCEPNGDFVQLFRTELFDCANFGACRQRGGFDVWREQALPGDRLHCVFSSGAFVNTKAAHPAANTVGGIPKIAATNCAGSAPAHTIVGVYADQPIISMTFDSFQPLCSAHGCASNEAGTHCSYAHGQPCLRAKLPAYVMKHVILLRTPNQEDSWYVAARREPYLQYRFETQALSKEATVTRDENPSESMLLRAARLQAAEVAASPKKRKTTADSCAAATAAGSAAGPAAASSSSMESVLTPVESQQLIIDHRRALKAATSEVAETKQKALPAARTYKPSKKHSRAGSGSAAGAGVGASQPPAAAAAAAPLRAPKLKRKSSSMDDDDLSQCSASVSSRASSSAGKGKVRYAMDTAGASSDDDEEEEDEEDEQSSGSDEEISPEDVEEDVSVLACQPRSHSPSRPAVLVRRGRPSVPPIQLPHRHSINSHALFGLDSPVILNQTGFGWPAQGPLRVLASPEPMPSHHTLGSRSTSASMPLATPPFCRTPVRLQMSPMSGGSSGPLRRPHLFLNLSVQPVSADWMSRSGSNTAVQPASPFTPSRVEPDETYDHAMRGVPSYASTDVRPLSGNSPTAPGLPPIPSAISSAIPQHRRSVHTLLRSLTINIDAGSPAWPQPSPQLPYDTLAITPLAPTPQLADAPGEIDITMT